jgi:hypothetical protein
MWISRRMTGDRTPTHAYIMQCPANRVKLKGMVETFNYYYNWMRMLYLCVCCWVRNSWSCLGATLPFPLTPSLLYHQFYHPTKFQTPKNTQIPISKETVTTRTIHIKKQLTHPPKKNTHTLTLPSVLFCFQPWTFGLLLFLLMTNLKSW